MVKFDPTNQIDGKVLNQIEASGADRFLPRWEAMMRFLGAGLVCIAVLYGVDAHFFDGRYKDDILRAVSDIIRHW